MLDSGEVSVKYLDTVAGEASSLTCHRLFIACGPVASFKIVAKSRRIYKPLKLKYQPYFLFPAINRQHTPPKDLYRTNSLAQLYIQLRDRDQLGSNVHFSVYTYNDFIQYKLRNVLGFLPGLQGIKDNYILGRLMAVQGYLDSDTGSEIEISLDVSGADNQAKVKLVSMNTNRATRIIKNAVRKIFLDARYLGFWPVSPMLEMGVPGDGNHIGGVFPMMGSPGEHGTDKYGRLEGKGKVHVVDSSIMPSLPAGPPTFSIMANAYRIGAIVSEIEEN